MDNEVFGVLGFFFVLLIIGVVFIFKGASCTLEMSRIEADAKVRCVERASQAAEKVFEKS